MWILKGTLLGRGFWFGTVALLYFAVYRNMRPNSAVGMSVIAHIRHRTHCGGPLSQSVLFSGCRLPACSRLSVPGSSSDGITAHNNLDDYDHAKDKARH